MRAALVCLATAYSWSRLELALQNYPRVHDRNLRAFEKGDPAARIVRAKVKNGLGNREQALLSCFALALAANAALVVEWPPRGCDNYAGVAVGDETPFSKLLPLLGDRGGIFVASDGHSAWLQQELYAAARARNVSVVELGLPPGAVGALAENYALSECDRLVPTRRSSFFRLAAVRSKRPHVRAVWACPATELQARVMASSGSTVESCNIMAQCPAPGGRYTY